MAPLCCRLIIQVQSAVKCPPPDGISYKTMKMNQSTWETWMFGPVEFNMSKEQKDFTEGLGVTFPPMILILQIQLLDIVFVPFMEGVK